MQLTKSYYWSALAVSAMAVVSVRGGGFDLPDQDAFALGRGMAVVATADNPSAIYFNPAGINQLTGNNFRGGIYGIFLDPSFRPPSGAPKFENRAQYHAIPQIYLTHTADNSPLSFGLGIYSPFGLGLRWAQDTGFRTIGLQSSITYMSVNPVVALQVLPSLSLGAGVSASYVDADLRQGLFWPTQPYDNFRFDGTGWGVGGNLGLLWKPVEKISLGVSSRIPASVNLNGHTEYYNSVAVPGGAIPSFPQQRVDAKADFPFPIKVVAGISYRPTPKWNLEFDVDYTDWSALGTVTIRQAAGFPPLLPRDLPLVLDWTASCYYEFGVTHYFDNGWLVSAGYIFNQNSDPGTHYSPLAADLDRHFLSLGTGYRGKRWDMDIAYQFGYGPPRTVSGSAPSAVGQTADGSYEFISHAIAVSVGLHF